MLRDILFQNNQSLLSETERQLGSLIQSQTTIPTELNSYFNWLLNYVSVLLRDTRENLRLLDYEEDSLLSDVLSKTQDIRNRISWFDDKFVSPIYRTRSSDRLCLIILNWLHSVHPQTKHIPLAFSDGDFASFPVVPLMSLYFIPPSAQQCLLNLPLLFHEFGHILYACHAEEMDDLVGELQEEIVELLQPASRRSDLFAKEQAKDRKKIVEAWHEWTQELFCDAVGFQIGGTAFVHAFSRYLQMLGRSQFHIPKDRLIYQAHPVSWLRVRILAQRVRQNGYDSLARELEDTWNAIAISMGITEDYYGYYDDEFLSSIEQTIEDMLVEANPYCYSYKQSNSNSSVSEKKFNSVELLDRAWQNFLDKPSSYYEWEKLAIQKILETDSGSSKSEINPNGFNLVTAKHSN